MIVGLVDRLCREFAAAVEREAFGEAEGIAHAAFEAVEEAFERARRIREESDARREGR